MRDPQGTRPLPPTSSLATEPRRMRPLTDADDLHIPAEGSPRVAPPTRALARRPVQQQRPRVTRAPMHDATLFALVACVIGAIGIIYLLQTSEVASLGYRVSELERERAALTATNQQLSYETAMREALPTIEERAAVLGMEPITDLIYLDVPAPVESDLPLPTPEVAPAPSLLQRLKARLLDESSASDADAHVAPAATEGGAP